ncbi:MAG: hypothetical protein LBT97_02755, partial [Planctomycetota bacterium]|nr:hypothetical protein [Planctomycetota bacterium]
MKPVLAALKALLEKGQAASVATLVEYALAGLNKQCLEMEYDLVNPEDLVNPLVSLHVLACTETRPEPLALADWLYRLDVRDAAGNFGGIPWEKYKQVLGKTRLARFRQLVETDWAKIPALKTRDGDDSHSLMRSRLQEIVMRFTWEDGDVDAQAATAKTDLSHSGGYLTVDFWRKSNKPPFDSLQSFLGLHFASGIIARSAVSPDRAKNQPVGP